MDGFFGVHFDTITCVHLSIGDVFSFCSGMTA